MAVNILERRQSVPTVLEAPWLPFFVPWLQAQGRGAEETGDDRAVQKEKVELKSKQALESQGQDSSPSS